LREYQEGFFEKDDLSQFRVFMISITFGLLIEYSGQTEPLNPGQTEPVIPGQTEPLIPVKLSHLRV
jgi:hypothetical protein